jgi:hypothetical protein
VDDQAMMLFLAGGRTDPTQTLLFMQASIPLSVVLSSVVFGSKYVGSDNLLSGDDDDPDVKPVVAQIFASANCRGDRHHYWHRRFALPVP